MARRPRPEKEAERGWTRFSQVKAGSRGPIPTSGCKWARRGRLTESLVPTSCRPGITSRRLPLQALQVAEDVCSDPQPSLADTAGETSMSKTSSHSSVTSTMASMLSVLKIETT
jgi:hypothetical protein